MNLSSSSLGNGYSSEHGGVGIDLSGKMPHSFKNLMAFAMSELVAVPEDTRCKSSLHTAFLRVFNVVSNTISVNAILF